MSVAGISSAVPPAGSGSPLPPTQTQATRQAEDQAAYQLFQDLRSGNASAAEQDYATLSSFGQNNSGPWTDPKMAAAFQTVGQDIQSGDLSGALSTMQGLGARQIQIDQAIAQKDNASGNIAAYQQAMANLQGDTWAIYGNPNSEPPVGGGGPTAGSAPSGSGSAVSVQA